jgi:acid phosphatase (class A)
MTRRARLAALLIVATLSAGGAALAEPHGPPPAPRFLSAADVDLGLALPRPPAEGSSAQGRELSELKQLQAARAAPGWTRARWDDSHEDGSIFAAAIGPAFDLGKLPATARLLDDVRHEEKIAAKRAKSYFKRQRPWIVDPSLTTCSREDGPLTSYPSGHAVMAYSMAVVLEAAIPSDGQAIMARADDYAENRLVCGMHFRSDIQAGKALGTEVGRALLAKPGFQAEVRAAADELAAAR